MFALPMALARQFVEANHRYHDRKTPDAVRNGIVTDMLAAFREEDPSVSVWDMLALFDTVAGDELSKAPADYFIKVPRIKRRRAR